MTTHDDIWTEIRRLEARINVLEERVRQGNEDVVEVQEDVAALQADIRILIEQMASMTERWGMVERIDERTAAIHRRLDVLEDPSQAAQRGAATGGAIATAAAVFVAAMAKVLELLWGS